MIIILGQPGSGKGTIAKELAKKLKYKHIDTGELLRQNHTKEMQRYMKKGKLIPTKLITPIIKKDIIENCILDGFPRTNAQARSIPKPEFVFYLDTPKRVLTKRLKQRAKLQHRIDDTDEVIKKRMEEYEKKTKPLLNYYKPTKINSNQSVQKVLKEIYVYLKYAK